MNTLIETLKNSISSWTPLHHAAADDAPETAIALIETGVNINVMDENSNTPLHVAALNNAHETAAVLLKHDADVNAKDNKGNTSLHVAAGKNAYETAEVLIQHGANVNAKNNDGYPLELEFWILECKIARQRDTYPNDVNGPNERPQRTDVSSTPLHFAASENAHKTTELLLSHGAHVSTENAQDNTPLHCAALKNAYKTAELLLKNGADPNAKNGDWYVLEQYKRKQQSMYGGMSLAMLAPATSPAYGERYDTVSTALHCAAVNDARETAEILFRYGADVHAINKNGYTPLHFAAANNSYKTARMLLNHGANVNAEDDHGNTPLHYAASNNAHRAVATLLNHGANVNAKNNNDETPNNNGETPLLLHARYRHQDPKVAELLLNHGADINAVDAKHGEAPLHYAVTKALDPKTVRVLLNHGANVNAENNRSATPLFAMFDYWGNTDYLTSEQFETILKELVNGGADINATRKAKGIFGRGIVGNTLLHNEMIENESRSILRVRILLAHGANVNAKNKDGETPLRYSERHLVRYSKRPRASSDVLEMLRDHGGKRR